MHLAITLIISALFSTCFLSPPMALVQPVAGASHYPRTAGSHSNRQLSPQAQAIAQRQHHVHRDLIDICISVDAGVLLPVLQLIDPLLAKVHLCLCINDLKIFLDTDIGIRLSKLLGSKGQLTAILKLLINTFPDKQQCTLPPHSHHKCIGNDPCGFECDPPYVPSGKICVCPPPLKECNGQCGNFPNGCGSAVPRAPKQKRVTGPITTLAQAQAFCKHRGMVCGIPGREDPHAFECVDTSATLDSCGGCVTPHRFPDTTMVPAIPSGVDCGHLPGVVASGCVNSRCMITQCRLGWRISADKSACEEISAIDSTHRRRMKKARRGTTKGDLDMALLIKLRVVANHALTCKDEAGNLPHQNPPSPPTPGLGAGAPQPVDTGLVDLVVNATINLLNAKSWPTFDTNLDALIDVSGLVSATLNGCHCVDLLNLHGLLKATNDLLAALLDLKTWCSNHLVRPPPTSSLSLSSGPSPTVTSNQPSSTPQPGGGDPPQHDFPLDLGLGGFIDTLLDNLNMNVDGVVTLNGLLDAIIRVIIKIRVHSRSLPPPPSPPTSTSPSGPPSPHPQPPVNQGLIQKLIYDTANLLHSTTMVGLLSNLNIVLHVSGELADSLDHCNCVSALRLEQLVEDVYALLDELLALHVWCQQNPGGPGGGGLGVFNIDAHELLTALGLGDAAVVKGMVNG